MKKNKWILLSFFLVAIKTTFVQAMTESEIRDVVLKNFPLINEATLKFRASQEEVTSASGAFDHKISVKSRNKIEKKYENQFFESSISRTLPWRGVQLIAGHRQGNGVFAPYDGKYETSSVGEVFMGLTAPLLRDSTTDSNRTQLKVAKDNVKIQKEELHLKKNMTIHKALSLYYKFLFSLKKREIRESILTLADERQKMLQSKFRSGDTEKIKLNDNLRSIKKRKDELLKAEIQVLSLKNELSLYLSHHINGIEKSYLSIINKLELIHYLSSVKKLEYRESLVPQINILQFKKNQLAQFQKLYSQQQLPKLNIEVLGGKEISPNAAYDPENLMIGLKFEYPLENRKSTGKSLAQEYKVKAIFQQISFLKQQMSQLFQTSHQSFLKTFSRWETISQEVKNTKRLENAERKKWIQGQSNLYIVSLREQDTADAEIRRWDSFFKAIQHYLDLKLISAQLTL